MGLGFGKKLLGWVWVGLGNEKSWVSGFRVRKILNGLGTDWVGYGNLYPCQSLLWTSTHGGICMAWHTGRDATRIMDDEA